MKANLATIKKATPLVHGLFLAVISFISLGAQFLPPMPLPVVNPQDLSQFEFNLDQEIDGLAVENETKQTAIADSFTQAFNSYQLFARSA